MNMFAARSERRAAVAASTLTIAQLEAIVKAKRAAEPSWFDTAARAADEAQIAARSGLAEGIRWLADCIRP